MKEEVIIDINLEQEKDNFTKLASLKSAITTTQQSVSELKKAYKDGNVTLKEYTQEVVRLEANQKKLSAAYTETQRKVTGLKNPFDDLKKSIKEQSEQINIAGISLKSFVNPVTATVAILGGLFKAYTSSTIGAKDFEFASNQLGAALSILNNDFAKLLRTSDQDGSGFLAFLSDIGVGLLSVITNNPGIVLTADRIAKLKEELEDLVILEQTVRGDNAERLAQNAELLQQVQDSQVAYTEKIHLTGEAIINLRKNEEALLDIKKQQLSRLEEEFEKDKENKTLQLEIERRKTEIDRITTDTERKVNNILKLESNITDQNKKQLEADYQKEISLQNQITLQESLTKKRLEDFAAQTGKSISDVKKGLTTGVQGTMNNLREANSPIEEDQGVKTFKEASDARRKIAKDEAKDITNTQQTTIQAASQAMQQYLQQSSDAGIGILKGFIASTLRAVKIQFEAMILGQELSTKGFFGFITAGIEIGILEAAFAAAETALTSFAGGGKLAVSGSRIMNNHGIPVNGPNGDNRLIYAKIDEAVLNGTQIERLGGPAALAAAGVPGYNKYQRSFATGGQLGFETRSAFGNATASTALSRLSREFQKLRVAVVIEDVEAKSAQRAQIRDRSNV